jgi:hypothetical protein
MPAVLFLPLPCIFYYQFLYTITTDHLVNYSNAQFES